MPAKLATRPGRATRTKAEDRESAKTYKSPFGRWDAALHLVAPEVEAPSTFAASRDFAERMRAAHPATPQAPRRAEARRQATRERVERHLQTAATTAAPQQHRPTYAEVDAMLAKIPVGRYALPRREASAAGNTVTFFEVTEYRGRRRIVQLVGGVGDYSRQTLNIWHQFFAAQHILADVPAAAKLYGDENHACGFCAAKGRFSPLTHERSRAAGYGEHCAKKHGMPY